MLLSDDERREVAELVMWAWSDVLVHVSSEERKMLIRVAVVRVKLERAAALAAGIALPTIEESVARMRDTVRGTDQTRATRWATPSHEERGNALLTA